MSAFKAADVPRKLKTIADLPPLIVAFGPDRGLVTETARRIAALFDGSPDPFAVTKLDAATVTSETGRLSDEARTVSMFGGKRLVWVRDGGGKNLSPALAPLMADPPSDAVVLVEAGDLRRGVGLRKEAEAACAAIAIHCPADTERDLVRMIDEEAAALDLTVDDDARAALLDRIGADRAASRGEVAKACLHAAGTGRLTLGDVDAVVGDVSASQMSEAVDAALLGERARLDKLLTRLLRQDTQATQLLMTAQWMLQSLEPAAAAMAEGASASRAVEGVRPPLYGPRKVAATRILGLWTPGSLRQASHTVSRAIFRTRTTPHLAAVMARDALLRIVCEASPNATTQHRG